VLQRLVSAAFAVTTSNNNEHKKFSPPPPPPPKSPDKDTFALLGSQSRHVLRGEKVVNTFECH
jgi:hypothetical protein